MKKKRMETQPSFVVFKPPKLHVPINRPRFAHPFKFMLGNRLV
jgi:hypothetical protein